MAYATAQNQSMTLPSANALETIGIGVISGLWGPLSIAVGVIEIIIGYWLHFKKGNRHGSAVLVGGVIATLMGVGEFIYIGMATKGLTTRASLEGFWKILYPSAYGFELVSKLFAPKAELPVPSPEETEYYGFKMGVIA